MNYLSKPLDVQAPIARGDINFDVSVASNLQSRYDANKAQVDGVIAQYESLRGLTDTDNAYIAAQVSNIKNQVNKLGGLNLAYNTGRDTILNNMKNVLKDKVVQDILVSKSNYDGLMAEYQKVKEKDSSKAPQENLNYALYKGGYFDYLQGKTKKVGSMGYTPFTDYRKEQKDIADNLEKYDTKIQKTWKDNQGYIYTEGGEVITADKLRKIQESFLSDGAKKQMVIDGFSSIHVGNTEEERMANTTKVFGAYKKSKLDEEAANVAKFRAQANKTGLNTDKEYATIAEQNYKNQETYLNDIEKSGSAEQMYGTVYKGRTIDDFANTFAYNTVDITDIKGDTTHMAKVDMAFRAEQNAIKNAMEERKFQLELKKAGMTTDANGNIVGDGSAFQTKTALDSEVEEAGNVQMKAYNEVVASDGAVKLQEDIVFNKLDAKIQKEIDEEVANSKGTKTRADVLIEYRQGNLVTGEDAKRLNELVTDRYVKQSVYNGHAKAVDDAAEKKLDSPELFKELFDNPNIKIMWKGTDGKERLFPAKEVLLTNKMVNDKGEKTNTNANVLKAIKKSMLADKINSTEKGLERNSYIKQLAMLMGENSNDVIKTETSINRNSPLAVKGAPVTQYTHNINPNTITGKFLEQQRKGGGYDKTWGTDSFDDINSANAYFKETDPDERNRQIGLRLQKDETVTFGKIVMVQPGTPEYTQIATQAGFNIKDTTPIAMTKIPDQPDMVAVAVGEGAFKRIEPNEVENGQKLRISELHPNVLSQVNLYNTRPKLNVDNFPPMSQNATYSDKVGTAVSSVAQTFYGGNTREIVGRAKLTTKKGALEYYFDEYDDLLGTETNPTKLGGAVKNMIYSEDNKVETEKTVEGGYTYILPVLKKGDKTVFTPDPVDGNLIDNNNADSTQRNIRFIPQDYFNNYVITLLKSQNKNQIDNFIKIYGK